MSRTYPENSDRPWSAAEHRHFERQQWGEVNRHAARQQRQWAGVNENSFLQLQENRMQTRALQVGNGLLEKQNNLTRAHIAVSEQIYQAQLIGNMLAAQQLEVQKSQLEAQLAQLDMQRTQMERDVQQRIREDMRAFAQWRQTEDGKAFVSWALDATGVLSMVDEIDTEWAAAWDEWRHSEIPAAEWEEWETRDNVPPPPSSRPWPTLGALTMGLALILLLIGTVVPSAGTLGLLAGLAGLGLLLVPTFQRRRYAQRLETHRRVIEHSVLRRVHVFGFDPVTTPSPNEAWTETPRAVIDGLSAAIDDGVQYHTHPSQLPEVIVPAMLSPSAIRNPALRAVAERWSQLDRRESPAPRDDL